jgi:hypothetical protein
MVAILTVSPSLANEPRTDCGYGGITASECHAKGCLFDNKIANVPWCFNRTDCGYPGITASKCGGKDCLFHDKIANVPWCFKIMSRLLPPYSEVGAIPLLDVWGEGRINDNGLVTGFNQAYNLNKDTKKVSNGPNKDKDIPNLVPVRGYDNPKFPLRDGVVKYLTVMGAPINSATTKEICRVLKKGGRENDKIGIVVLYGYPKQEQQRKIFETTIAREEICKGLFYMEYDSPLLPQHLKEISLEPLAIYWNRTCITSGCEPGQRREGE